jgi:two-component system response regulator HydG
VSDRLFVIDDHRASAEALAEGLQDEGYEVSVFTSPTDALAMMRTDPPDVVVTDLRMDEMDGIAFLRAAHVVDPGLPVILVTAYASIDAAVGATRSGAFGFVTKPLRLPEMVVQVRNAVALRTLTRAAAQPGEAAILGRSAALLQALSQADRAAQTDLCVLIGGESGTGKELLARRVHLGSRRSRGPFVPVSCGAIAEGLIESELFGAAKGSYTGADRDRQGLIEAAEHGTLFLDEVGELSAAAQVRLLRFLQEGTLRRVGETKERAVDVRVIAATHRDLKSDGFREDLYFRLAVLPIQLPPLRARGDDVLVLFGHALAAACARFDRPAPSLAPEAVNALRAYAWPGNVRELMNVAERLAVMTTSPVIVLDELPPEIAQAESALERVLLPEGDFDLTGWLEGLEERALHRALARHEGVKARAAASLGLERNAFRYKLKKYGIDDP